MEAHRSPLGKGLQRYTVDSYSTLGEMDAQFRIRCKSNDAYPLETTWRRYSRRLSQEGVEGYFEKRKRYLIDKAIKTLLVNHIHVEGECDGYSVLPLCEIQHNTIYLLGDRFALPATATQVADVLLKQDVDALHLFALFKED